MKFIRYNKDTLCFSLHWKWKGKYHDKYLSCPFGTWWKARKYFVRPKFKFFAGKHAFWPFASTEFLKWYTPKWFPIYIGSNDIMWKDKWNTPRFELDGYFMIAIGRNYNTAWQFGFIIKAPEVFIYDCTCKDHEDNYWESMLWYLYYSKNYGMKSYEDTDLVKARNSFQNHWSTSDSINVKKFKIMSTGVENVLNKEYFVVSLKCKYLVNELFWNFSLTSEKKISIDVEKDGKHRICFSYFMCNTENNLIKVYILKSVTDVHINEFIEMLQDNPDDVKIDFIVDIDLGPAFKDQFLNKKGIKLIKEWKQSLN